MRTIRLALVATFALGAAMAANPPAAHAATTDGSWNVLIITEKGSCDRSYSYNVDVANGRVNYSGSTAINLAGTVAPDGAVKVSIKAGNQGASGTGRLSGSAGTGTWRNHSSDGECAGRWEAVRR
jgi:hypothetical protein